MFYHNHSKIPHPKYKLINMKPVLYRSYLQFICSFIDKRVNVKCKRNSLVCQTTKNIQLTEKVQTWMITFATFFI